MLKPLSSIFYLLVAIILCSSCDKNLDVDNTPAINANRNGEFFGAQRMVAVENADGSLTITGVNPLEQLVINLESSSLGTYELGPGQLNEAIYVFNNTNAFTTNRGAGRGTVRLRSSEAPNSISGSFDFVSYLPGQADSLYMRQGIIYQVPFGNPLNIDTPGDGAQATFNALIDGVGLNPSAVVPFVTGGNITISAANDQRQTITLLFPENIAVGTYDLATTNDITLSYTPGSNPLIADMGTFEITAINTNDGSVAGTFSATLSNGVEITQGVFSVEY